ncbi:MAG: hypothetical protein HXY40_02270 [Chloroflexi bacterium]|nr:hypothetical protein [Chloroflexota bacterium]
MAAHKFILAALLLLTACNLVGAPAAPSQPLDTNSSAEIIELATSTSDAPPTVTALPRPIPTTPTIAGLVWHDRCAVPDEATHTAPTGCLAAAAGLVANGILDVGETGIAGVYVTLGTGACPSDGLSEAITDADGAYTFDALESGTYCVAVNALRPENLALLVPGLWTAPALDNAALTVILTPGESKLDANFGWDFEFAP